MAERSFSTDFRACPWEKKPKTKLVAKVAQRPQSVPVQMRRHQHWPVLQEGVRFEQAAETGCRLGVLFWGFLCVIAPGALVLFWIESPPWGLRLTTLLVFGLNPQPVLKITETSIASITADPAILERVLKGKVTISG